VTGPLKLEVTQGDTVALDASGSNDPDGDALEFEWLVYPEVGSYRGRPPRIRDATAPQTSFVAPNIDSSQTIHLIVEVSDRGSPPLTRYARLIVTVKP
jgi:hypothetical protein